MIVLMTGAPGNGKTAHIVHEMTKIKNRPFFVMGIPDLKLDHFPVPPVSEWTERVPMEEDPAVLVPRFTFPANAIVIIDEAQNIYRPRASGAKVPDNVAAFETHRHLGIDFWLITQHPNLLDQNIRRLIKKHWHIHDTPLGRKLLEWSQCRDPDSKTDRADAVAVNYKPSKKVFDLYKSAEAHTAVKRRIPMSFIFVIVLLNVLLFAGYVVYSRIQSPVVPGVSASSEVFAGKAPPDKSASLTRVSSRPGVDDVPDPVEEMIPRYPAFPESAAAFEALRTIVTMPRLIGCAATGDTCRCYTQQGTQIDVPPDQCKVLLTKARFDPYRVAAGSPALSAAGGSHALQ